MALTKTQLIEKIVAAGESGLTTEELSELTVAQLKELRGSVSLIQSIGEKIEALGGEITEADEVDEETTHEDVIDALIEATQEPVEEAPAKEKESNVDRFAKLRANTLMDTQVVGQEWETIVANLAIEGNFEVKVFKGRWFEVLDNGDRVMTVRVDDGRVTDYHWVRGIEKKNAEGVAREMTQSFN